MKIASFGMVHGSIFGGINIAIVLVVMMLLMVMVMVRFVVVARFPRLKVALISINRSV